MQTREAQVDLALTHVDQGVQAGEPWAEVLIKETYNEVLTDDRRFDRILLRIKRGGWSIGRFLEKLFTIPKQTELSRSRRHAAVVSSFLGGSGGPGGKYETVKPDEVVELMYSSRDSTPKATCQTPGQTAEKEDRDPSGMARALLSEWAIRKVEGYVSTSAAEISSKDGGFHLRKEQTTWEFIHGFSLAKAILPIELKAGVLLRILAAAALPPLLSEKLRPSAANPSPYSSHLSRPVIHLRSDRQHAVKGLLGPLRCMSKRGLRGPIRRADASSLVKCSVPEIRAGAPCSNIDRNFDFCSRFNDAGGGGGFMSSYFSSLSTAASNILRDGCMLLGHMAR
ncbi:hypothetical protein DFH06DRAFT_1331105 [Mycena polygramma]|nr:hypothetical protein DFH06DRAFT_1331105 [Mycena polygramma]